MSEELCEAVARELSRSGLNAVTWDSGGGMVGVGIATGGTPPEELRFFFGTADVVWGGEVLDEEGEVVEGLRTGIPSDSDDARQIAAGILRTIADFVDRRA